MKKLVSILLCVIIIISSFCTATVSATTQQSLKQAIESYEAQSGEKVNVRRYYFLMPNGSNGDKSDHEDWFLYDQYVPSWYNSMLIYPTLSKLLYSTTTLMEDMTQMTLSTMMLHTATPLTCQDTNPMSQIFIQTDLSHLKI